MTLMKALKRRWKLALSLGVVVAAAAGVGAWMLLTPRYTVSAQMQISSKPSELIPRRYNEGGSFVTWGKTRAMYVKNRHVLSAALKDDRVKTLDLVRQQPDPILWLEDELKIDYQEGSEIVKVSMMGSDPAELIMIVDAVAKAYLAEMGNIEHKERSDRLTQLEEAHSKLQANLRQKRETLKRRNEETGLGESGPTRQKYQALLTRLGDVGRDIPRAGPAIEACIDSLRDAPRAGEEAVANAREGGK